MLTNASEPAAAPRRVLATRNAGWAVALTRTLAASGIRPNAVSVAGAGFALASGTAFYCSPWVPPEGRGLGRGPDAPVPEEVADERRVRSSGEFARGLATAQAPKAAGDSGRLAIGNWGRCGREVKCHRLPALIVGGGRARSEGRVALLCGKDPLNG